MFACAGGTLSDPDVQYDRASDRWFFTSTGPNGIALAVSVGATPLAPYVCYQMAASEFGGLFDQPRLSVTDNKVSITVQLPDSATLIINKEDVIAGLGLRKQLILHDSLYRPARGVTGAGNLYLVADEGKHTVRVKVITGEPGVSPIMEAHGDITVPFDLTSAIPNMVDPDGIQFHDRLNSRTFHSVEVNGILYILAQTSDGTMGGLGLVSVSNLRPTFSPTTFMTFTVDPPDPGGLSVSCPALAVTPDHDVVVGFSAASPINFLSIYLTGRHLDDPANTLRPVVRQFTGTVGTIPFNSGSVINSDYCDAVTAPDGKTVVLALNYQRTAGAFTELRTRVIPFKPSDVE